MNRVRLSLRLRAALHEIRCQECNAHGWRAWFQRLLGTTA